MKGYCCFLLLLVSSIASGQGPRPNENVAIGEIESLGGRVYRDPNGRVQSVSWASKQVTDANLPLLHAFPDLRQVYLDGSQVTDVGLEHLMLLPKLEEVYLRRTRVTPAAAEAFRERHGKVYHVETSPGFRPARLLFAAMMGLPLAGGLGLIALTLLRRDHLAPPLFARGMFWGIVLIVGSLIFMAIAIVQALGFDLNLANLFG